MKVVHINTHTGGGAAISAIRLHKALLSVGVLSSFLSLQPATGVPQAINFASFINGQGIATKLSIRAKEYLYQQKLAKILAGHTQHIEVFSLPDSPYDVSSLPAVQGADVIILHWVAGFIDYQKFFKELNKPVVWMMHDMFPFTGGCHYAGGCDLYKSECEVCPLLEGTANAAFTHKAWQYQHKTLKGFDKLHIAAPSQWLVDSSKASSLFGDRPHYHIPYSVNEKVFKPINPALAREVLNLPADKKIILFVAEYVDNKRKGFSILTEAINYLPETNDWLVCTIGSPLASIPEYANIKQLGMVRDELLLGLIYSAADVFVIPSLEDNLPNTVIEALMCGTPAIGFRKGGIQEMIEDGENGYLCHDTTAVALAEGINRFLAMPHGFDREKIAKAAAEKYSINVQANKFLALLEQLTEK